MYGQNTRERGVSVAGGWLGTYRYGGMEAFRPPVRFEASFRAVGLADEQLTGQIVDDCALGTSLLSGRQQSHEVRFSKTYTHGNRFEVTGQTEYAGILSDDGTVMRGTWQLRAATHGVLIVRAGGSWEARRIWTDEENPEALAQSEGQHLDFRLAAAPG